MARTLGTPRPCMVLPAIPSSNQKNMGTPQSPLASKPYWNNQEFLVVSGVQVVDAKI